MFRPLAVLAAALLAAAPAAVAHDYTAGALTIDHPWARPILAGRPGAAYAVIRNAGPEDDRLLAARSPLFPTIELHTHVQQGDVLRMERVDAIALPAGGEVAIAPGGVHLMLFGGPALAEGTEFPMTFVFERAGEVEVVVQVEKPAADAHAH